MSLAGLLVLLSVVTLAGYGRLEIHRRGNMAFVAGHSTITPDGGGAPVVVGRYLDIRLGQADGTWPFHREMVSPVPPPEAKRE